MERVSSRRRAVLLIFIAWGCFFFFRSPVFAGTDAVNYLCEFGSTFYQQGRYDDALSEFKKVLILDPNNQTAQEYINRIFQKDIQQAPLQKQAVSPQKQTPPAQKIAKITPPKISGETRAQAIERAFQETSKDGYAQEAMRAPIEIAGVRISGEAQARLGAASTGDFYWKRANWDLNEKNWRILSVDALNKKENTYDPRIYDRLRVNLATNNESGLDFYSNITVDPWSYTGKSSKFNIFGQGGDMAPIELKYWSNTGYTINENVNTRFNGDSFALPEIKVVNGKISTPVSLESSYNNVFTIPDTKIYSEFQPLREFWVDYKQDNLKLRAYPVAYENQAVTFDDPLRLSNNHIWWENSPWINSWTHGNRNTGATPEDFNPGLWDNSLAFFTRDSEGQRLTALRGFSLQFSPLDGTYIDTNIASPKDPWQAYSEVDNFLTATRIKQSLFDKFILAATATTRLGYNVDNKDKPDAANYVFGTDFGYEIIDGLKANFEYAYSRSKLDMTDSQYNQFQRGNAYHFSLLGRFPFKSILDSEFGYDGITQEKNEPFFSKFRFFATRMDSGFNPSLSSYVETRDDEFWSRHLHFRKPFQYYYQGEGQTLSWDDVKVFGIGNGVDIGRSVLGLRVESALWDKMINNLFDVRNVHDTKNKFVENVARDELTVSLDDKFTLKMLGIYQRLPETKAGTDPFIFDPQSRRYFLNDLIVDGKDPSIATGSLGMEYNFFDWLGINGTWEYTNDISLAYDNFPRGILNTGERSFISIDDNNKRYRDILDSLYNQGLFPKPPYPYYNIFKAGLRLTPLEKLDIYLDYTRNPYEKAGQVDDNMNHVGIQMSYTPIPKLAMFLKYNYSRWQDLDKLQNGITKLFGHHNFFAEFIYRHSKDEDLTFQYGEASRDPYMGGVLDIGWDPYGGSLRTIDTQHIFRLYYRRKF